MIVDIGGKYMDLDTDTQYLNVIRDRISYQFAEIIEQKMCIYADKLLDTEIELDLEAATSEELREALKHIEEMAWRSKQKAIQSGFPDKLIELFRDIEEYAGRYN